MTTAAKYFRLAALIFWGLNTAYRWMSYISGGYHLSILAFLLTLLGDLVSIYFIWKLYWIFGVYLVATGAFLVFASRYDLWSVLYWSGVFLAGILILATRLLKPRLSDGAGV